MKMRERKLYKSNNKKMLAGVCGGFSDYFDIDVTVVRLIAVCLCLIKGIGILAYIICVIVIPDSPDDVCAEDLKSANVDETTECDASENTKRVPHTDEEFDSFFRK